MDWLEVLKIHKGLEFFFDVSIPAAIKKGTCFGHVLFICGDPIVRQHFAEEVISSIQPLAETNQISKIHEDNDQPPEISVHTTNLGAETKASEIAASLTNLSEHGVLLVNNPAIEISDECADVLCSAMDTFSLEIIVGKGAGTQSVRLDLPKFTFVMCAAYETEELKKIEPHFSYVIKIPKSELSKICEKTAIMKAQEEGFSISDEALEHLAKCADCNCMAAENYTARVLEYMKCFHSLGTQITREHTVDVLYSLGIRPETESSSNTQNHDVPFLLENISKQLESLRREVSQIKESLEDLKGDGAKYSISEIGEKLDSIEEFIESIG